MVGRATNCDVPVKINMELTAAHDLKQIINFAPSNVWRNNFINDAIHHVRGHLLLSKKFAPKNVGAGRARGAAGRVAYPKDSLLSCLRIPQGVIDQNAGEACTDREAAAFAHLGWAGEVGIFNVAIEKVSEEGHNVKFRPWTTAFLRQVLCECFPFPAGIAATRGHISGQAPSHLFLPPTVP